MAGATALLLGICAAVGAGAAPETGASAGLRVATVDSNILINKYNGTLAYNQALQKKLDDYQKMLQTWKQNPLLSEDQQKRLGDLVLKDANLTDAEKAEKQKLQDQSNALSGEFLSLQNKLQNTTSPTSTDKDRYTLLTKLIGDTNNRIQQRSDEIKRELTQTRSDNTAKVVKELRDTVLKVAQQKGYNLVLGNDTAWYSEADITDDVLDLANGTKTANSKSSGPNAAHAGASGPFKIACVDALQLMTKYNGTLAYNQALQKKLDNYQQMIQTWKQNPLLPADQQKRLGDLVLKGGGNLTGENLTEAEKAEKQKLLDQSNALFAELNSLQTKAEPTATDKDRINTLTKLAADTDGRIQQRSDEIEQELTQEKEENMARVLKELHDGVAKVAQKKGYNLVLGSDTAWYAEADITDDVLKQVNGSKQASSN
jgi:Skp family chaperone for outer membrane proteins